MKKTLLSLISVLLVLSLGACGGSKKTEMSTSTEYIDDYRSSSTEPAYPDQERSTTAAEEAVDGEDAARASESTAPGNAQAPDMAERNASGESYLSINENEAKSVEEESMLTFSLKVDTAAYTNITRYIESGSLPPADAVRTEEMINYFNYDTPLDFKKGPFAIYTEVGPSPFDSDKHVAFVRVATKEIDKKNLPSSNLTFLIDTSGSMYSHDKLPLLKESFSLLVETLDADDVVSIVTYAGSSEVLLDSVSGANKNEILEAIHSLEASGSTAGADGIHTAYKLAEKNYRKAANNRVILATDGDFNVGVSNVDDLSKLVSKKKDSGVYLSILGFGTGNIREDIMETLSKDGNGNYSYINNLSTAQKVLVEELGSNLFTVADDVKAQVEFNPDNVKNYRLIGYENRALANEDFEDDTKDAGEIGVGTDVVVMFEIELTSSGAEKKYQSSESSQGEFGDELFEVRIRYKDPGKSDSKLIENPVKVSAITSKNSSDYNFACSVAAFGHILRDSGYTGDANITRVMSLARDNRGKDSGGYRGDFVALLNDYIDIAG